MALLAGEPAESGASARAIEAHGFDGTFSFEGPHDPFVPLVVAARETTRLELGTAIAVAFARNPMSTAQVAQDLQRVAGGRFWLGLGSQVRAHVERRFSMPWSRPAARMREFVAAIRAIWRTWSTGEPLAFRGEFYTHTLMTPLFSPGPNPFGDPPILVAGVGPRMIEVAGEVGDGLLVHPLNTPAFLAEDVAPALRTGLARGGRARRDFTVSVQTLTMIGADDEGVARARAKARAQVAFYCSTPAYRVVLERHGREALQPELHALVRAGRWAELPAHIDDDLLDTVGVSGTPAAAGRALRARNAGCERTGLVLYDEAGPGALADLVRGFRGD